MCPERASYLSCSWTAGEETCPINGNMAILLAWTLTAILAAELFSLDEGLRVAHKVDADQGKGIRIPYVESLDAGGFDLCQ